jgi:predicted O-methyltransferase YrrM
LIELPSSIETAELMISKYNVTDRIEIIGMNMFTGEWPQENDTVLFTNIFHDWEQDKCQALAEKALAALQPGGLILLQEVLLNEDEPDDLWPAHFTLATALYTNGRQFYARELIKTLEAAGFVDVQVRPLFGYYSSVVGVKPSP